MTLREATDRFNQAEGDCKTAMERMLDAYSSVMMLLHCHQDPFNRALSAASMVWMVPVDAILSRNRTGNLPLARWCIMDWMHREEHMSKLAIATLLKMDHGTVRHGLRHIHVRREVEPWVERKYMEFQRKMGGL